MSYSFATPWTAACRYPLSMELIFPGKNTGVGCHFLLQGIFPTQGLNLCLPALAGRFFPSPNLVHPKFFSYFPWDVAVPSPYIPVTHTPWTVARQAPLSMDFSGKNTGVGCHSLLQGIFPAQGKNPRFSAPQADSFPSEPPSETCHN